MNQRLLQLIRISFAVLDMVALNVIFIATRIFFQNSIGSPLAYANLHFLLNLAWLGAAWMSSTYTGNNVSSVQSFCKKTLRVYVYFVPLVMLYLFFSKQSEISRVFTATILSLIALGFLVNRIFHLLLLHFLLKKEYLVKRILILGHNSTAKKISAYLEEQPLRTKIIGFCEDESNMEELTHYPVVGSIQNVIELSRQYKATDIYSTIAPEQNHDIYNYMQEADQSCIRFKFIPNFDTLIRHPVHMDYLGQIPMLSIRKEPLDDVANRIRKRVFDLAFSTLITLCLLSWLVPLLALIIRLDSKGPVFFVQKRTGVNNKTFSCIKFRTMRVNRDAHSKQASKGDQRITKLGRFLRKSNLDELPQFFNVLMSDMTVVGPRPHMLKHTEDYSRLIGQYMVRQFLKPGITGWAQVNGFRGETRKLEDMKGRVERDLWYMENWSLWLDTKIIFLTVANMFKGESNAY
jgi:putative colanic acid biosysnthesis UDP-glucose lipid carrier transferase